MSSDEPGPDTEPHLPDVDVEDAPAIPGPPALPSELSTLEPGELPQSPTDAEHFAALVGNLLEPVTRKLVSVHTKLDAMGEHQDKHERRQASDWKILTAELKGARHELERVHERLDGVMERIDAIESRVTELERVRGATDDNGL